VRSQSGEGSGGWDTWPELLVSAMVVASKKRKSGRWLGALVVFVEREGRGF
jgi:hypothetical protein